MKNGVRWNPVYGWKAFASAGLKPETASAGVKPKTARSAGMRLICCVTGALTRALELVDRAPVGIWYQNDVVSTSMHRR